MCAEKRLRATVRNPQWLTGHSYSLHTVSVWWPLGLLGLVLLTAYLKAPICFVLCTGGGSCRLLQFLERCEISFSNLIVLRLLSVFLLLITISSRSSHHQELEFRLESLCPFLLEFSHCCGRHMSVCRLHCATFRAGKMSEGK